MYASSRNNVLLIRHYKILCLKFLGIMKVGLAKDRSSLPFIGFFLRDRF